MHDEREKKYFEGGAHFKYTDLVNRLIDLIKEKHSEEDNSVIINEKSNNIIIQNDFIPKNINLNLLTINNHKIKNFKSFNTNKYILNTDKNIDIEKERKKKLNELLNYNIKLSPFKNNILNNSRKLFCHNSIEKNHLKPLKTMGNFDDPNDSNKLLCLQINIKNTENNNFPLIQSSYFNNLSNRNIFMKKNGIDNNNNLKINLKQISRFTLNKSKVSKNNLFLKNKILSPIKNIDNFRNNIISNDFSEKINSKNFETIEIYTKIGKNFKNVKLSKFANNHKNLLKKNINTNNIHFSLNKNE